MAVKKFPGGCACVYLPRPLSQVQYLTTNSASPFQRKGAGLQKFSELIKVVFSKDNFSLQHMEYVKQCYKV